MSHNEISDHFKKIIDKDEVMLRLAAMEKLFDDFKAEFCRRFEHVEVYLNRALLLNLVISYFYDIERLKCFHGCDRINEEKKAGYLIKWLVRVKPIQFYPIDGVAEGDIPPSASSILSTINENFALLVGAAYADINLNDLIKDDENVKNRTEALLYHLHFRPVDPSGMTLFFNLFRNRN